VLGQVFVNGIAVGAIYALVAIGFVLVYQSVALFNFAQAEYYTLGGMLVYTLLSARGLPFFLAVPGAVLIVVLVGILSERIAFRRLIFTGAPQVNLIIASIALGIILRSIALLLWGPDAGRVLPVSEHPVNLFGLNISAQQIFIIAVTVLAVGIVYWLLNGTKIGLALRATASNRKVAGLMGIRVTTVLPLAFGLSAGVGALGGILVAPIFLAQFSMGQAVLVKAFAAGILGGLNSIPGVIVGGVTLGLVESIAGTYMPSAYKDVVAFAVLIVVLALRPQGILGGKQVEKV